MAETAAAVGMAEMEVRPEAREVARAGRGALAVRVEEAVTAADRRRRRFGEGLP